MSTTLRFTEHEEGAEGIPTEMSVIAAIQHKEHCDGREPLPGIEGHSVYLTFPMTIEEGDEEYTAYGRTQLRDDGTVVIVAQFEDDVSPVMDLAVGDVHEDYCGCKSKVVDLATLAPAFGREYKLLDVVKSPSSYQAQMLEMLARVLGYDGDEPSSIGDIS